MVDFIIVLIIVLIVGAALLYIRKERKRGVECIGCPESKNCRKQCAQATCASCKQPSINLNIKVK